MFVYNVVPQPRYEFDFAPLDLRTGAGPRRVNRAAVAKRRARNRLARKSRNRNR